MPDLARVVIRCVGGRGGGGDGKGIVLGGVTGCGEEGDDELEEESVIGLEAWLEVGLEGGSDVGLKSCYLSIVCMGRSCR